MLDKLMASVKAHISKDPADRPVWLNFLLDIPSARNPRDVWWDFKYTIRFYWSNRVRGKLMRLVPRGVKKWAVVEAAVKVKWDGHPTAVTYMEMVDVFEKNTSRTGAG